MRIRNQKRQIGILINDQFHPPLLFPLSEHGTISVMEHSVLEPHALALVKCVSLQEGLQSQNLCPWMAETDDQLLNPYCEKSKHSRRETSSVVPLVWSTSCKYPYVHFIGFNWPQEYFYGLNTNSFNFVLKATFHLDLSVQVKPF